MKKATRIAMWSFTVFVVAYLTVAVFSNGPDSIYSKKGFVRLVGYPPPPTVSKIYYWHEDLWLDPAYRLRFVCPDPAVVKQFIGDQQLQECKRQIIDAGGLDLEWWTEKNNKPGLRCFSREIPQNFRHLWYDPVTGTVWYEEYST